MNRTQIYLPKSQLDALRRVARERSETISEVIRALIRRSMEASAARRAPQRPARTLFRVLEEIEKIGERGPADLATNVDKYLYGEQEPRVY